MEAWKDRDLQRLADTLPRRGREAWAEWIIDACVLVRERFAAHEEELVSLARLEAPMPVVEVTFLSAMRGRRGRRGQAQPHRPELPGEDESAAQISQARPKILRLLRALDRLQSPPMEERRERLDILFMAANPMTSERLPLDEEVRSIQEKLRMGEFRDVNFVVRPAARPGDVQQALLEVKPEILHFSGHGCAASGLILQAEDGEPRPVSGEALAELLSLFEDLRILVLNTCSSESQAKAACVVVDCVVGMAGEIDDNIAAIFATGFYRGLVFGESVRRAFELGRSALSMHFGIEQGLHRIPRLFEREPGTADRAMLGPRTQTGQARSSAIPRGPGRAGQVWQRELGPSRWKYSPIVLGDILLVAVAGSERFPAGVHALDAASGRSRWFYETRSAPTQPMIADGAVVLGERGGSVHSIELGTGKPRWQVSAGAEVVSRPLPVDTAIGVFAMDGTWRLLNADSGAEEQRDAIGTRVVADAVRYEREWVVISREGRPVVVSPWECRVGEPIVHSSFEEGPRPIEVSGQLLRHGRDLVQGYVRNTVASTPPVLALPRGLRGGAPAWEASAARSSGFGNIRGQLTAWGDTLLACGAYNPALYALDDQGRLLWELRVGYQEWPQWASPVVEGDLALVPRHDGFLHIVDLRARRRTRSVYLGRVGGGMLEVGGDESFVDQERPPRWHNPAPLISSPTVHRGLVFQASAEGWLYALDGLLE